MSQSAWVEALWAAPTSGFIGAGEHLDGTFVHTDHVFDDKGADVSGSPGGDFGFPADGACSRRGSGGVRRSR